MSKSRQRFRDIDIRRLSDEQKNTKLTQKANIIKIATFSRIGFW